MKLSWMLGLCVALGVGVATGAPALADTPVTLAGTLLATVEEVVKLQAAGATLIDTRVASEFAEGHIPGAINVPYREKSAKVADFDMKQDDFNIAKLPGDKAARIVMYCNGPECWKSYKASIWALKAGYSAIHWYREGFPDWKAKGQQVQ